MSVKILRPGDYEFREAYLKCKPVIEFHVLQDKIKVSGDSEGYLVSEVFLASSVGGRSVVLAIKESDFEYYFRRNLINQTWEKSYSLTPTRGPVEGPTKEPNKPKLIATMKLPSDWMKAENVSSCSSGVETYLNRKYISGGQISSGTITNDKLTTGYGSEIKHFSEIYNELIRQNQAEHFRISPVQALEDAGVSVSKEVEEYCNADVRFTYDIINDKMIVIEEKKEMSNVVDNKLYLVIGEGPHKGKYVTKIAINKANEFVVEAKGENAYFSVKETDLERVLPYSVDVRFMAPNGAALNGRVYSYWSNPGDVAVGDVIFSTEYGNPMIVVAVDTKAESATKFLTGSVIKPTKVLEGK